MSGSQHPMLYTFFGRVHPERCDVSFSDLRLQLRSTAGQVLGDLRCYISHSQVSAIFSAASPVENVYTLKNNVEDAVRTALYAYGFTVGCGYDLEITQLVDSSGGPPLLFGVGIPAVAKAATEAGVTYEMITQIYSGGTANSSSAASPTFARRFECRSTLAFSVIEVWKH